MGMVERIESTETVEQEIVMPTKEEVGEVPVEILEEGK